MESPISLYLMEKRHARKTHVVSNVSTLAEKSVVIDMFSFEMVPHLKSKKSNSMCLVELLKLELQNLRYDEVCKTYVQKHPETFC